MGTLLGFTHCPAHDDSGRPNLAVYEDGGSYCFRCHFHEPEDVFLRRIHPNRPAEVLVEVSRSKTSSLDIPSLYQIKLWQETLLSGPRQDRLDYLTGERGLTMEWIEKLKLGHTGRYFTIPILHRRQVLGVKKRVDPVFAEEGDKRYLNTKGVHHAVLRPNPSGKPTIITEGEFDCILVCQYGMDGISPLTGAGGVSQIPDLTDLPPFVYVATDQDPAGDEAWTKFQKRFSRSHRLTWTSAGKDLGEALLTIPKYQRGTQLRRWLSGS